jgi:hypothetical protein
MPRKNPEAERFGGPGSSRQGRAHSGKNQKEGQLSRTRQPNEQPIIQSVRRRRRTGQASFSRSPPPKLINRTRAHQGLGEGDGPGVEERRWKSLQPSNGHFFLQALVGGIESGERSPILCIERQRITRHEKKCILRDHHPHRRGLLCRCPDALVNGRNQRRWHYKAR